MLGITSSERKFVEIARFVLLTTQRGKIILGITNVFVCRLMPFYSNMRLISLVLNRNRKEPS